MSPIPQSQASAAADTVSEEDNAAVPGISTSLTWRDHLGGWAARWGIGRMNYRVAPGLYRVGQAKPESPVLVTANYKLSFDALRRELTGIDAWILVLDTKGVNVWCAAGKGSFGTQELIQRISSSGLSKLVSHRRLILPQLGATGVTASHIKAFCGFTVVWGPVLAADLPAFLASGQTKTLAMRTIRFDWRDRLVLTPIELVQAAKWLPIAGLLVAGLAAPLDGGWPGRAQSYGLVLLGAWSIGAVAFPMLLPWLPFRAFGLKGLVLGLAWVVGSGLIGWHGLGMDHRLSGALGLVASGLFSLPATVFLAMNFTGSSTFTCQPGATTEVRRGLPLIIVCIGLGLVIGIGQFSLRVLTGM